MAQQLHRQQQQATSRPHHPCAGILRLAVLQCCSVRLQQPSQHTNLSIMELRAAALHTAAPTCGGGSRHSSCTRETTAASSRLLQVPHTWKCGAAVSAAAALNTSTSAATAVPRPHLLPHCMAVARCQPGAPALRGISSTLCGSSGCHSDFQSLRA